MANQEHLAILKQGAQVWNQWRKAYSDVKPNLSRVNLFEADLVETNLAEANLFEAILTNTDLSRADLFGADLSRATLSGANLFRANFHRANLSGANLSQAYLTGTAFSKTNLTNTDFNQAKLLESIFVDVDLRLSKDLDVVNHAGPSSMGIDTITRSQGQISEVFLRGVGVPEAFIIYARSLVNNPIEYYTCFISYSSKDQNFAERLHADLQRKAVRCWFAPEDLKIGAKIRSSIDESIRLHDKLLLVLSQYSVASQWVEQEVERAFAREHEENKVILFPIRLDNMVMEIAGGWPALIRNTRNIGDFTRWKHHDAYQKALDRLLRDLKAGASKPEA